MVPTKLDLERSLDSLDSFNILDSWANSSMTAENALLFIRNDSGKRHLIKSLVDFGKD